MTQQYPFYKMPGGEPSRMPEPEPMPEIDDSPEGAEYNYMQNRTDASSAGVIKELDPKNILLTLHHQLMGETWDDSSKKWIKVYKPMLNETGIGKFISMLSSAVTSLTTFSNFDDNEIRCLVMFICEEFVPHLYIYHKEFGCAKSDLGTLTSKIVVMTYSALQKAKFSGDRNVIGRTISENIATRGMPLPDKKTVWDKLPFRGSNTR